MSRHTKEEMQRVLLEDLYRNDELDDLVLLRADGVPMHQIEQIAPSFTDDRRVRLFREGAQGA